MAVKRDSAATCGGLIIEGSHLHHEKYIRNSRRQRAGKTGDFEKSSNRSFKARKCHTRQPEPGTSSAPNRPASYDIHYRCGICCSQPEHCSQRKRSITICCRCTTYDPQPQHDHEYAVGSSDSIGTCSTSNVYPTPGSAPARDTPPGTCAAAPWHDIHTASCLL